jgi:hypothetical protein
MKDAIFFSASMLLTSRSSQHTAYLRKEEGRKNPTALMTMLTTIPPTAGITSAVPVVRLKMKMAV